MEPHGSSETVNIRAGTLDHITRLVPIAHFFTRSAQSWVSPATDAVCHEAQPTDVRPWLRLGAPSGRNRSINYSLPVEPLPQPKVIGVRGRYGSSRTD